MIFKVKKSPTQSEFGQDFKSMVSMLINSLLVVQDKQFINVTLNAISKLIFRKPFKVRVIIYVLKSSLTFSLFPQVNIYRS